MSLRPPYDFSACRRNVNCYDDDHDGNDDNKNNRNNDH
jgi:hypothetical protein